MDSELILHEGGALSAYATRDDVRELGDRLLAMHPAAAEVGANAMRAAAQLALLLGANPLPAVNEVHIWKDNKGRNCMSLGINYWRRKGNEWGGYLYQVRPRPMKQAELTEYGIPSGTIAAICIGVRTRDMLQFKAAGFTTNEIWDMCGRTGIGTQGPNEYAKSGRPNVWTSLKRAETDMLRQLFPAEFAAINGQLSAPEMPASVIIDPDLEQEYPVALVSGIEDSATDDGEYEDIHQPPTDALLYADGSFVAPAAAESYAAYIEAHNGKAPDNVHNLRNWYKSQKNGNGATTTPAQPATLSLETTDEAKAGVDTAMGLFD